MKRRFLFTLILAAGLLLVLAGCSVLPSRGPQVRFVSPENGAAVSSPVHVVMDAQDFTVEAAGEIKEGAGHLHIMVDAPCLPAGEIVPKDDTHLHYGDGSTEAHLELAPGEHTLCLQAADGAHTALPGAAMTQTISVTVR
jgi:Domain of unknown function (DUF4399)